jgi:hypothetical protein
VGLLCSSPAFVLSPVCLCFLCVVSHSNTVLATGAFGCWGCWRTSWVCCCAVRRLSFVLLCVCVWCHTPLHVFRELYSPGYWGTWLLGVLEDQVGWGGIFVIRLHYVFSYQIVGGSNIPSCSNSHTVTVGSCMVKQSSP